MRFLYICQSLLTNDFSHTVLDRDPAGRSPAASGSPAAPVSSSDALKRSGVVDAALAGECADRANRA